MFQFLILSLATWRICVLLQDDFLPFHLGEKLRYLIGVRHNEYNQRYPLNQVAEMLLCIYCLSLWISLPVALYFYRHDFVIYWLALSATSIGLDKVMK